MLRVDRGAKARSFTGWVQEQRQAGRVSNWMREGGDTGVGGGCGGFRVAAGACAKTL